jgi:flagellar protein FliO/FliZ
MVFPLRSLTLFLTSCIWSCVAAAAGSPVEPAGKAAAGSPLSSAPDPISMTSLWQLTLGMLMVLALIVGLAWVLKRTGRFQMAAGGGLRILGGLSMGARERVVLLQVGETQLLVGVAPGRVQTLHVLEQPLPVAAGALHSGSVFADQLGRFLHKEKTS